MVPGPLGAAASVADAGIYAVEGDYVSAGMSLMGVIPGGKVLAGAAGKTMSGIKQVGSKAGKLLKGAEDVSKIGDKVEDVAKEAERLGSAGESAAKAGEEASKAAKGGVYTLRDEGDNVVYVGRSNNLARREGEHALDEVKGKYRFNKEFETDVYAEQRGLEQMVYEEAGAPSLNKILPISMQNKSLGDYLDAADRFLSAFGG
jgi:predicted GIY-YIG superfamily endonuclease